MNKTIVNPDLFGTWATPLEKLIESQSLYNIVYDLNVLYELTEKEQEASTLFKGDSSHEYSIIYPEKIDIFKAFRLCNWNNLKVVILGQEPYANGSATGLAYANNLTLLPEPELDAIFSLLYGSNYLVKLEKSLTENDSKTYEKIHPDVTLESLARQGVLFLNAALTVAENKKGSHFSLWNEFTLQLLEILSEKNVGIIYCLWGSIPRGFKSFINNYTNIILEAESPEESLKKNKIWMNPHFETINLILKEQGKEIIW